MNQEERLQQRRYKEAEKIRKRHEKLFCQVSSKKHTSQFKSKHNYKKQKEKKELEYGTFKYLIAQKPVEFGFMILAIIFVIGVIIFITFDNANIEPVIADQIDNVEQFNQDIDSWDTSNVTDMSDMFEDNGLWDTSSLHESAIEVILNNESDTYDDNVIYNKTIKGFIDFDISSPLTLIFLMILPLIIFRLINKFTRFI